MIRISHIITDVMIGGAELMLYNLLSHIDRAKLDAEVISLTGDGPVGTHIKELGVPVRALGMRKALPSPLAIHRLRHWLKERKPHIVQTWMYHANLAGALAMLRSGIPMVWSLHSANLSRALNKTRTLLTVRACALLSRRLPSSIVCCSQAAGQIHSALGYSAQKMVFIPNGVDTDVFRPDPEARVSVRQELGVPGNSPVVGSIARFDPQKDHRNLILAAVRLHAALPDAHFLCCGEGMSWENPQLAGWIFEAGLSRAFHLLGRRGDVPRIAASLDVACSSSLGEAFPLAVVEAMASGVPCVVTDVGDCASLIGETGRVVPPGNSVALAHRLEEILTLSPGVRQSLGQAARSRIQLNFSMPSIAARYQALYDAIAFRN